MTDSRWTCTAATARLKPALLVILPMSGAVGAIGLNFSVAMGAVAGPLSAVGFTLLLAQFGRDFGSKKQPYLYNLWGGKPTTAKLRHRDGRLNPYTLARYHAKAAALLGKPAPIVEQERENPDLADLVYEAYGDLLRELTRDRKTYPLIFQELVNYGFRRNLWGMKAIGIAIATLSIALQVGLAMFALLGKGRQPGAGDMAFLLVDVFMLGCWFLITPNWVRIAAEAYADRLLAASEYLDPK